MSSKSSKIELPTFAELSLGDSLDELLNARLLNKQFGIEDDMLKQSRRLVTDSREIRKGDIFLAYRGVKSDGHDKISEAIKKGATVVICEIAVKALKKHPHVIVTNARKAWSFLSARSFAHPQRKLTLVGITGTNGKTSTVWHLRQLLLQASVPVLSIGTLGTYVNEEHIASQHTTPDPPQLYGLMALALARGINLVCMEVSSHSIAQEKLGPCRFSYCGFTSFSQDHLDFHETMQAYRETKMRLFRELVASDAKAYLFQELVEQAARVSQFGLRTCIYGNDVERFAAESPSKLGLTLISAATTNGSGTRFSLHEASGTNQEFRVPLIGTFAIDNFVLASIIVKDITGRLPEGDQRAKLQGVPGRLELVEVSENSEAPLVVVDYAHTPDALEKALKTLRQATQQRLILVFGCGGDRDKTKRAPMGAVAANNADLVIITSDNPRNEDPEKIAAQICKGTAKAAIPVEVELDRKKAIAKAIKLAKSADTILIAGKGHETYMEIKGKQIKFDDRIVATQILAKRKRIS